MKQEIQNLMQDAQLVERLRATASLAESATLLIEAAAQRGVQLARDAVLALVQPEAPRPRELSADELMSVGGGLPAESWGAACSNSTFGHTCCWHCY